MKELIDVMKRYYYIGEWSTPNGSCGPTLARRQNVEGEHIRLMCEYKNALVDVTSRQLPAKRWYEVRSGESWSLHRDAVPVRRYWKKANSGRNWWKDLDCYYLLPEFHRERFDYKVWQRCNAVTHEKPWNAGGFSDFMLYNGVIASEAISSELAALIGVDGRFWRAKITTKGGGFGIYFSQREAIGWEFTEVFGIPWLD